MSYTKRVTHTFEAGRTAWEVTYSDDRLIIFGETRKNGQEDDHMFGQAVLVDGRWRLDARHRNTIGECAYADTPDAIEAFFNEHGAPEWHEPPYYLDEVPGKPHMRRIWKRNEDVIVMDVLGDGADALLAELIEAQGEPE